MAPEVLKSKYNTKCDIWSLGVVLYVLLSGYLPFIGDNAEEVFDSILEGKYSLEQKEWSIVSEEGIDFLKSLLTYKVKDRPTAEEAIKHPWFEKCKQIQGHETKDPLDEGTLDNL